MSASRQNIRLSIVSRQRSQDTSDFVMIEQEDVPSYGRFLTKYGLLGYLNKIVFNIDDDIEWTAGGAAERDLYFYPRPANLNFVWGVSYGETRPMDAAGHPHLVSRSFNYTEVIQCDLETEHQLKYPAVEIISYEWVGEAYNQDGEILEKQAVTLRTDGFSTGIPVYGTILITYKIIRCECSYIKRARPSINSVPVENSSQSFAYAVWDGGNNFLELTRKDDEYPGVGDPLINLVVLPDDWRPDHVEPDDEYTYSDYCTGEEVERPVI